jgi:hypothetical protein
MLFGYHHEAHSRDTDGHARRTRRQGTSVPAMPRRLARLIEGCCFVAVHESAVGTTRTFRNVRYSVAVGCKADIEQAASKTTTDWGILGAAGNQPEQPSCSTVPRTRLETSGSPKIARGSSVRSRSSAQAATYQEFLKNIPGPPSMRISGLDGYRGVAYPPFRAGQAINELRYVGWGLVPAPRNVLIRPDQREARLISV